MIASTVRAVVQSLVQDHGRCKACGSQIQIRTSDDIVGGITLTARCHGSTERRTLDVFTMHPQDALKPVVPWLKNLFAADCNPDVRELLLYNRGEVPSSP